MRRAHTARILWSPEQIARGLPGFTRTIDPTHFDGADPIRDEGWSLICDFDVPPAEQDHPSTARVRFMVDWAPHERLAPGTVLWMFERATQKHARVEILD
ncbi:MAG TPA: hypothetical protein VJ650_16125 [Gemmatimonadaceae bacterium]|nr:hypothetical protein [Gemmatimonadaceae bacterium]